VLGLTPETIGCAWPLETDLLAVDHSQAMIAMLWPPVKAPPGACAIRADWRAMPILSGSMDLITGDGCYPSLSYPAGYAALTSEVARVLRNGGRYVTRVFLRPDRLETVADIASAVERGIIGSVHALKLRLLAALHGASGEGTCLGDVWLAWKTMPALPLELASTRGWTAEEITGIEGYRGLATRYFLPTLAEIRAMLAPAFVEIECIAGSHELGDRCPTLVLARS
jgi:SAM-dependent methyltransferase